MNQDMQMRMKLVAKAARSIANAIKAQKIGQMKNKNELSSQENTEPCEDGAFGMDLPEEDFTGQNLEGTKDFLANPQESTNDITQELSEAVDKSGDNQEGDEEGRFMDKGDKGFSFISIKNKGISAPNASMINNAALDRSVPKNNKKKK